MPLSTGTEAASGVPGWYGKIASLGDFASRRLPSHIVARLDDWLQRIIAGSRSQLGEAWLETYLTSPIWRFLLFPETLDEDTWAGLLMPSVDKVGRYFPLCVATLVLRRQVDAALLTALDSWLARVETIALDTLDTNASVQHFDEAVCATSLDVPLDSSAADLSASPLLDALRGDRSVTFRAPTATAMGDALASAGSTLFNDLARGAGVWWSPAKQDGVVQVLICRDLPDTTHYVAMLRGSPQ